MAAAREEGGEESATLALVGSGSAAFFFLRVAPLGFLAMDLEPTGRPAPVR